MNYFVFNHKLYAYDNKMDIQLEFNKKRWGLSSISYVELLTNDKCTMITENTAMIITKGVTPYKFMQMFVEENDIKK